MSFPRTLGPAALLGALLMTACAHEAPPPSAPACFVPDDGAQSHDLLCREPVVNRATVKHILIAWRGVSPETTPASVTRTYDEARALARDLLRQLHDGATIERLMEQYSHDPGSAKTGGSYDVTPSAGLVSGFKSLSLRLEVGEAGIVQTQFGLHVIKRIE